MAYSPQLHRAAQVTERGLIYYSDDLLQWTPRETGTNLALRAVTFLPNGRMVAVGESGTVVYSDDLGRLDFLKTGTLLSGATTDWFEGLAVSSNKVVAVGDAGAIYVSADGATWKRLPDLTTTYLSAVTYGTNGFVAVGEAGAILSSTNGTNWIEQTVGSADWSAASFGPMGYLVVGRKGSIATSTDGRSWKQDSTGRTNDLWTAAQNDSSRLIGGTLELLVSEGGGSWTDELTRTNTPPPPGTFYASFALTNYFLTAGRLGIAVEGFQTSEGLPYQWIESSPSVRSWLWDVTRVNQLWVSVGQQGTILTSEDAVDWELEPVPAVATTATLLGVGGDTNVLIAVGSRGTILRSPNELTNITVTITVGNQVIVTNLPGSTLGLVWRDAQTHPTTNLLQSVAGGLGRYVIVGEAGEILHSLDGNLWTRRTSGTTSLLSSVVAVGGGFFACGQNGIMLASANGQIWRRLTSPTTQWLFRARAHGNMLVAVGENGTVLTSEDQSTWVARNTGSSEFLTDVAWSGDWCFVSGQTGTMLATTNYVNWMSINTFTYRDVYGLGSDDNELVLAGTDGLLLRAPVVTDVTPVNFLEFSHTSETNGVVIEDLFLFGGQIDQRFVLEATSDVAAPVWREQGYLELSRTDGTLGFLKPSTKATAPARQYYRTRLIVP